MGKKNAHPSNQDLLLFADGELPARRAAWVRRHLAACWNCRTQAAKIAVTIGDFMEIHRQTSEVQLPPLAGPHALLKARLAESARDHGRDGWQGSFFTLPARGLAYVCALALLVALGARIVLR